MVLWRPSPAEGEGLMTKQALSQQFSVRLLPTRRMVIRERGYPRTPEVRASKPTRAAARRAGVLKDRLSIKTMVDTALATRTKPRRVYAMHRAATLK